MARMAVDAAGSVLRVQGLPLWQECVEVVVEIGVGQDVGVTLGAVAIADRRVLHGGLRIVAADIRDQIGRAVGQRDVASDNAGCAVTVDATSGRPPGVEAGQVNWSRGVGAPEESRFALGVTRCTKRIVVLELHCPDRNDESKEDDGGNTRTHENLGAATNFRRLGWSAARTLGHGVGGGSLPTMVPTVDYRDMTAREMALRQTGSWRISLP